MELIQLNVSLPIHEGEKVQKKIKTFQNLLGELGERKLPVEVITAINAHISDLNGVTASKEVYTKELRKRQSKIITLLQKECKIVPKHYYRNLWMVLGMSAFGLPLGTVFGAATKNMGLLGIGLPIGMCIGIAVGSFMDTKAKKEGKQLEFGS
jgi:hypothetical protein